MAEDSFQERTEQATPKRREKAREQGQVAKSLDLNSAVVICLGFTSLFILGPAMVQNTLELMRNTMANAATIATSDSTFQKLFGDYLLDFLRITLPMMLAMVVIGIAVNVAQVGFHLSPKALEMKFEKLNVVSGLQRLISMKSMVQLIRDPLKLLVVCVVAYFALRAEFDNFFALPDMSPAQFGQTLCTLILMIALKIGVAILIIAILDYLYQRYEFDKSIKMSKQEIKEEYKDSEGNPLIKQRVRQIQRDMSRRRMMADVPTADVVVTNPTHIAVALKYDSKEMDAPTVVAKGQRLIAERIKEIAREHGIPIVEDKPLARALYKMCNVGQIVPASLYRAVAEILAHIYRLKQKTVV
jgi:flagellar biosynthetic protein FlhB